MRPDLACKGAMAPTPKPPLQASILFYAKEIAEAQSGSLVKDAVIAVPAFFGQAQRRALIDAGQLAGLNVMGIINSHTAAALQYGIERDFSEKTQNVVLYDMGSGSTEVALIRCVCMLPHMAQPALGGPTPCQPSPMR